MQKSREHPPIGSRKKTAGFSAVPFSTLIFALEKGFDISIFTLNLYHCQYVVIFWDALQKNCNTCGRIGGFFLQHQLQPPSWSQPVSLCHFETNKKTKWLRPTRTERHQKTNTQTHTKTNTQRKTHKDKISPSNRIFGSSLANPQGLSGATDLAQTPQCRSISVAYKKNPTSIEFGFSPIVYKTDLRESGKLGNDKFSVLFICYNDLQIGISS